MTRAYALYRSRSLLVFPDAETRETYLSTYLRFDRPPPLTEEEATAWRPVVPGAKKMAIWRDETGKWRIQGVFPKASPGKSVQKLTKEGATS